MKKLVHSLLMLLIASATTWAQNHHFCGTDHIHQQMVKEDPSLAKDLKKLIANAQIEKAGGDDGSVYIIPVVFHVLHQYGPENIPDANLVDAVEYMNIQFRKLNPDTVNVIPAFQNLIADTKIEFRLAAYDPWGNCTNGINRIYTHETFKGAAESKLNQWDRSKYLNIWVVNRIANSSAAGYSMFPTTVNGVNYWLDGIVMLYDYVGRLAPSNLGKAFALGHEAAHWLSIPHVWGFDNEPGVACGDDGIDDTPVTKGYNYCPTPEGSKICDTTVYENYQNYMDYSYCSYMFTPGQVAVMRHTLNSSDALRSNIITPETAQATGVLLDPKPICLPIVAINASTRFTCVGESVTFSDKSFNAPVTTREWIFQDGSPATSTSANPVVSFTSWGKKKVTLKVTNSAGEVSKVFDQYIDVQPDWSFVGPRSYDMETSQTEQLRYETNNDENKFFVSNVGYNSSKSIKLLLHKSLAGVLPGSQESRYFQNLNGESNAIITPPMDLRNTSGITFSFDYSYATNAVQSSQMTEKIKVYYSRDCGKTWVALGTPTQSTIEKSALATAGFAGNIDFNPTSASDWGHYSRTFNATASDSRTRFKIEFVASQYSNNLFIDNINVSGTLSLENDFSTEHELVIAPNPVNVGNDLVIEYIAKDEPVTFTLRNLQGEEILSVVKNERNQPVSFGLPISSSISAAYYFLEVKSASATTVRKIAVIK